MLIKGEVVRVTGDNGLSIDYGYPVIGREVEIVQPWPGFDDNMDWDGHPDRQYWVRFLYNNRTVNIKIEQQHLQRVLPPPALNIQETDHAS